MDQSGVDAVTDTQKVIVALLTALGISALIARRALNQLLPAVKPGVSIDTLNPVMNTALVVANEVTTRLAGRPQSVVTSTNDGQHMENSLHFVDLAFDQRRVDWPDFDNKPLAALQANEIRAALPDDFDVVLEPTHIHIEFDPKVRTA